MIANTPVTVETRKTSFDHAWLTVTVADVGTPIPNLATATSRSSVVDTDPTLPPQTEGRAGSSHPLGANHPPETARLNAEGWAR